jgi:hypothetical protein
MDRVTRREAVEFLLSMSTKTLDLIYRTLENEINQECVNLCEFGELAAKKQYLRLVYRVFTHKVYGSQEA